MRTYRHPSRVHCTPEILTVLPGFQGFSLYSHGFELLRIRLFHLGYSISLLSPNYESRGKRRIFWILNPKKIPKKSQNPKKSQKNPKIPKNPKKIPKSQIRLFPLVMSYDIRLLHSGMPYFGEKKKKK
jgi:hypothetical protein